ncbi:DUF6261 family protein [Aerococcaceae bacterium NML171108]|nr:DUF6261 family protein [Aerococcaceae bacterium NML171108]
MLKDVQKLNYGMLHHAEYAQLVARFVEEYEATKSKTTDEDFKRLLADVKTKLTAMQNALEQVVASEKSEALSQADTERDASLKALFDSIRPYRFARQIAEKDAYNALNLLFKQYRNTAGKGYEEETSLINSLLAKLKTPEYHPDVTTLGITKFVTNLTESQTQFNKVFTDRIKEQRGRVKYDVKTLRQALAQDYRLLLAYTAVLAQVKKTEFYTQTLTVINGVHKYYADNLARRKGKSKANATDKKHATPTSEATSTIV